MGRTLLVLLLATTALGQRTKQCLGEPDSGQGLSLAIDSLNTVHLARVRRVVGDVVHTTVAVDGRVTNDVVVGAASRLGVDEITDTDLLLVDDVPWVCFYNPSAQRLEVAHRDGPDWVRETVAMGMGAGRSCALGQIRDQVVMAFSDRGALWFARRAGDDDWATEPIDDGGDDDNAGRDVDLSIAPDGTPVAAHGDTMLGLLHLSWFNGFWQTVEVEDPVLGYGARPSIAHDEDGRVWIAHGLSSENGRRDIDSDVGLALTSGRLPGPLDTDSVEAGKALGGSSALTVGAAGTRVLTRQFLVSALFPDAFDLRLYEALPDQTPTVIERADAADGRRLFTELQLAHDPFELLVLAYVDDELTCVQRPVDSDEDLIPDAAEETFGTGVLDPDSDDDDVSDGLEVLRDKTNPLGDGPLGPDMAVPDMAVDMDVPDEAVPDAAVPDMAPDVADLDMEVPDAALVDAAVVDAAPLPDRSAPDGPAPDGPAADGAAPDGPAPDGPAADGAMADGPAADGPAADAAEQDAAEADAAADGATADGPATDAASADAGADVAVDALGTDGVALDGSRDAAVPDVPADDAAVSDTAVLKFSDVRVDGARPPLTSYLEDDRAPACACDLSQRNPGTSFWILLLAVGRLRGRRRG